MSPVRPPAVAGLFYPGDARELATTVDALLGAVPRDDAPAPKAVIAPHAGYVYSGGVAATAYAALARAGDRIRRVILLGPTHRVAVRGLALPGADALATPLGEVPVDADGAARALESAEVVVRPDVHAEEHSLEVHLPFLQRTLRDFAVVPLAVGEASPDAVAAVLASLWGGEETAVVVSSDLSHYLAYDDAVARDGVTLRRILALDPTLDSHDACGVRPVNGLLTYARRHGLTARLLGAANSGDTAGDRRRVVGYAAVALDEPRPAPRPGPELPALARAAITASLAAGPEPARPSGPGWDAPGATFVTLTRGGHLRGCIGSLTARQPLADDVVANARNAAFRDPRFRPVTADELDQLHIEVSVLSPATPIAAASRSEAIAALRPGVDGVILTAGGHRATYLPQVWDQLPDPGDFLGSLFQKAGLPRDHWGDEVKLSRYTVEAFEEM